MQKLINETGKRGVGVYSQFSGSAEMSTRNVIAQSPNPTSKSLNPIPRCVAPGMTELRYLAPAHPGPGPAHWHNTQHNTQAALYKISKYASLYHKRILKTKPRDQAILGFNMSWKLNCKLADVHCEV